ncbi:MAG: helix-turn-helix domain-containing protein [Candidatus Hydrothermarchaeota archaeon]|jgi:DNA-binding transcriptional ArsR family regulator|nr:helix-turn-helix domain-containing protein [Candidatus Hydrothermarchaeota archaeon]
MFKALSSKTRREMLRILAKNEMHISGLARELGISVPVAARHCRLLEEKGLIERRKFGRSHVLKLNPEKIRIDKLYEKLDIFSETNKVEVSKRANLLEALKKVAGIKIEKVGDKEFITSVDGEEGYYIFEVDGKLPSVPVDKFVIEKNVKIELKRLAPVKRKEMNIRVKRGLIELPEKFNALVTDVDTSARTATGREAIKLRLEVTKGKNEDGTLKGEDIAVSYIKSDKKPPTRSSQEGELNARLLEMGFKDHSEVLNAEFKFEHHNPSSRGAEKPYPTEIVKK